jgi:hypothetical protein
VSVREFADALPSPEEPAAGQDPNGYRAKLSADTLRALRRLKPAAAGRVSHAPHDGA